MQAAKIFIPGERVSVVWEPNTGAVPVKSNRVDGVRTNKIVLIDSKRFGGRIPNPNEKWLCEVTRVTNPSSATNGAILVTPISQEVAREFPGVWMPEEVRAQMPIILQTPGKNLFLQGDQGCGKTTMAGAIALGFGWEFCKVSGGAVKKYSYMLSRVLPGEQDGRLTFKTIDSDLAAFIKEAIRNPHKVFLIMIDEYTRIEVNARDILLDVIEGSVRFLPLPNGERLVIPDNVRFMAAGNVGSRFTVQKQDDANKSRWVILKVDYMPAEEEFKLLLTRYPHAPKEALRKAIDVANKLRDRRFAKDADKLSKGVSTRETDTVAMFLQGGEPLDRALKTAMVHQYDGDDRDETSEAYKVSKVIAEALK